MSTIARLFAQLDGDGWRINHPFNDDILQANALLHNTAATDDEMAECLALWCQRRQPCQFGKAAANRGRIHFCFLRETALQEWSDGEIANKITEEKRLWKQRAASDPNRAAHSLVIVAASPRVALAAPNKNLRAFSDRILELAGWTAEQHGVRRTNTLTSDFLYLKKPSDGAFYGFRFNVDFFACAGDRRWWQDHRFPGGIAFTANSTGHMMRFREWYQEKDQNEAWGLKQAMLTIQNAAPTRITDNPDPQEQGRVTWLRPLDPTGKPLLDDIACPLSRMLPTLEGKDWTRYEGVLHTDHAVREEFFVDREIPPTTTKPYLMDFTYLYNEGQLDFHEFSGGKPFSEADVYAEIGHPRDWTHRASIPVQPRSEQEAASVAELLLACNRWECPPWYIIDPED
jgi:hypothetical protein